MFCLILLPSGPARTISEFPPRRAFCTVTSGHHVLFRIHPAQTCFVFRNQCGLTVAKLLDLVILFLLSSFVWCSFSKLPCHIAGKTFLWVTSATRDCHQYLSLLCCPYGHELPGLWQPCAGRASCAAPEERPWHVPFRRWCRWWWAGGGQISFVSPAP